MGNSFHFDVLYFYGAHAVENLFCRWRAGPLRAGRSETTQTLHRAVSDFRDQPTLWLQVARTLLPRRSLRSAQPFAPPASFAASHFGALATSGASPPPALPALGRKKDLPSLAPPISPRPSARRAHHHQVAATALSDAPPSSPFPARSAFDLAAADPSRRAQRCLDSRFQGLLPHRRRHALRSAHRPRSLQPLSPGGAHPAAPAPCRGAAGVYRPVPSLRFAQGDPQGQWLALRQHGRPGTLGLECVVVDPGHPRRVHPTRPPGGKWCA